MGEESVGVDDQRSATAEFCREIEIYLCRKNDGHLIRVVGPSFDLVSRWAEQGVPLKVACAGIDRYFERYYRKGPRRRPVKIDFCDADVLDVFDEWKRAVGAHGVRAVEDAAESRHQNPEARHSSLPAHLERVVLRLTAARAGGALGERFDTIIDRACAELDAARGKAGGVRGDARHSLIARLRAIDADLLDAAHQLLDAGAQAALVREADAEVAPFRAAMSDAAQTRARSAAFNRLVRERFKLPTVAYD